jgi:hypothetical protein
MSISLAEAVSTTGTAPRLSHLTFNLYHPESRSYRKQKWSKAEVIEAEVIESRSDRKQKWSKAEVIESRSDRKQKWSKAEAMPRYLRIIHSQIGSIRAQLQDSPCTGCAHFQVLYRHYSYDPLPFIAAFLWSTYKNFFNYKLWILCHYAVAIFKF